MNLYNNKFYGDNISRLESSKEILSYLFKILRPNSVLDVGCGRGAWLKVSKDLGAKIIYGVDGEWKRKRLHFLRNINICFKIIGYPNVKKQL